MRLKLLAVFAVIVLCLSVLSAAPYKGAIGNSFGATIDTKSYISANAILMFVTNKGSFAYDQGGLLNKNDGLYFPFTTLGAILDQTNTTSAIFAAGIWVGAIDSTTGDTLVAVAEYSDDFWPGPMVGGTFDPDAATDPTYRVYQLHKDSMASNPNQDYTDWPVSHGAPVDGSGNPLLSGDQMLWGVYNDANPGQKLNSAGSVANPLGVEIRQTTFAFDRTDPLENCVFVKFQIYNMGNKVLRNMFVSLWADPDLGDAGDDFVGSDTVLSMGYCYNAGSDRDYGDNPPAVGFDFFQGPLIPGGAGDTAKMWGTTFPGFTNMPMTSFNKYINGTDPGTPIETYNYMLGLRADGSDLLDENGNPTVFYGAGDPATRIGFIDVNPSDRRYMLTTGPFDFDPGDSTEILAAVVLGRGGDRLSSISVMKYVDRFAQLAYDADFILCDAPAKPVVTVEELNNQIVLSWTAASEASPGCLEFQGYTVLQGESITGPWRTIANFDLVDNITSIIDEVLDPLTGQLEQRAVKLGIDNGLQRFFSITFDINSGERHVNYSEYYFRVEAYSYDAGSLPKTITSATEIIVVPQPTSPETDVIAGYLDTIPVSHPSGVSDGAVIAEVVSPSLITGDAYEVTFNQILALPDSTIDTTVTVDTTVSPPDTTLLIDSSFTVDTSYTWNLENTTTSTMLLTNQENQSGNDDAFIIDGMRIKVLGTSGLFRAFDVVANGAGVVDPPDPGALDFQGFPTTAGGNPTDAQQVGGGHWAFHTGDDGGSCDGGSRGSYAKFLERSIRGTEGTIGIADYEMRFTGVLDGNGDYDSTLGGGSTAIRAFQDEAAIWVPFEIWNIGIGTPDDPSDDVRMISWLLSWADGIAVGDSVYNLEAWGCSAGDPYSYTYLIDTTVSPPDTTIVDSTALIGPAGGEHSGSGADNDPFTDWIYWFFPSADPSAGESGYNAAAADMIAGTYGFGDAEVFARTVLVNWNGGDAPPFTQDLPEPGTVFRILTSKPNTNGDVFTFSTASYAQTNLASGEAGVLDNVRAVPNPYYLFSGYDNSPEVRELKFTNLPAVCTITIYNLSGDLIATVEKADATTTDATWDIQNAVGVPVGSGIYIYVVDAPGFGQKIGKMAIFTEVELLNQY